MQSTQHARSAGRSRRAPIASGAIAIFAVVLGVAGARAGGFERIEVDYQVTATGDVFVTETWRVICDRPTSWWYRTLPREGHRELCDFRIRDNQGARYETRQSRPIPPLEPGVCHVWSRWLEHEIAWRARPDAAPLPAGTEVEFTMEFTLVGAMQQGLRRDWLLCQPILARRDGAVKQGRVTIHLPAAVERFRVEFDCDVRGSRWSTRADPPALLFEAENLPPGARFLIRIDAKNGVVGPALQGMEWVATDLGLALFGMTLAWLGFMATRTRRSTLYVGVVERRGSERELDRDGCERSSG